MSDNTILTRKLELLAPAGTIDVFATAVEQGADAIYIGAPAVNARALARNFSYEEVAAMIDYGHKQGVKVYLAMNSLVKEEEIHQVIELLTVLSSLRPDALIIQDLGLYFLVKKYFPELPVHASTLMAAHNSQAVSHFKDMGFKRVVLAREMTLAEIQIMHTKCDVELEVFVHGALCFSYSGLCLFSSFQGGKSGLRGRCVQPCRRRYTWRGKGKGPGAGYLFSMNDLEALDLIPAIRKAGITSVKIEGRMRSASYVGAVVKAYRMVIDAGDQYQDVLPEARSILGQAMGRKTTSGYFVNAQSDGVLSPEHSGNIGVFLGKIKKLQGDTVTLVLRGSVQPGDRIRLHQEKSGDRHSFTLQSILSRKKSLDQGQPGEEVSFLLSKIEAMPGDSLYKVDVRQGRKDECQHSINPSRFQKQVKQALTDKRISKITAQLGLQFVPENRISPPAGKRKGKVSEKKIPSIWLKTDDLRVCLLRLPFNVDRKLLLLDEKTYNQIMRIKKPARHLYSSLVWVLPPIILEDMLQFYREAVIALQGKGFRSWQIGHISQLSLFSLAGGRHGAEGKGRGRSSVSVSGDYTLNILNSSAFDYLKHVGVQWGQISIESDKKSMAQITRNKKGIKAGITVFGRPPLFTARQTPDFFRYGQTFISPRGEKFELQKRWGQTLVLPERPFSLLSFLSEQPLSDLDYVVIDITGSHYGMKELSNLYTQIQGRGKQVKQPSLFNYGGNLQ
ncbi:MAG: U32 family peptidase [Desulfobulbaceae bacterium]|uniref:U32 family peptidase n=1 Tax=Candidatus Desulfobia pelagia TaxID=2841692 RepID=A0A8J6TFG7_9BACT|nr:U32 family peptidase [Candidatus Desulfobia pelagia]